MSGDHGKSGSGDTPNREEMDWLSAVLAEHEPVLRRTAASILRVLGKPRGGPRSHYADTVIQNLFLKVSTGKGLQAVIEADGRRLAYLKEAVRNEARSLLRKVLGRPEVSVDELEALADQRAPGKRLDADDLRITSRTLRALSAYTSKREFQVFLQRRLMGAPVSEVMRITGLKRNSIKTILHRADRKIRRALSETYT